MTFGGGDITAPFTFMQKNYSVGIYENNEKNL